MAVKYVKDFAFDSGFGFSGSSGKTPVRGYMRGGAVKDKGFNNSTRNPMSNFPDIAPAMVGKGPGKMGGKTSDVKPLSKAKANPQIAKYAKGGVVKKADGGMLDRRAAREDRIAKMRAESQARRAARRPLAEGSVQAARRAALDERHAAARAERDAARQAMYARQDARAAQRQAAREARLAAQQARRNRPAAPEAPPVMAKGGMMKKAMGGMIPGMDKASKVKLPSKPSPRLPPPTARIGDFRDENRNGIDDRDELTYGKPVPARMGRPRRGMAMIRPEDNQMMGSIMERRMRNPRMPMRPSMPEYDIDPEEIREYSRGRTFSPEAMYKKGGRVSKGEKKIGTVMREFKKGELHSGSKKGPVVTNPKQATAIALSEARKAGAKIPKKAEGGKIKAAVHKHEREKHPESPLTKLRKGGMACG